VEDLHDWPEEIESWDSDKRLRFLAQIKGLASFVSLILERSYGLTEVKIMVKVDDGEHVKYLLNETDYLRLINPQKKEL